MVNALKLCGQKYFLNGKKPYRSIVHFSIYTKIIREMYNYNYTPWCFNL